MLSDKWTNTDTVCNSTCCVYEAGKNFCFSKYNFTDFNDIRVYPIWELAVRWAIVMPITTVGILGNFTVIAILLKNRLLMRTNVNIFIFNMAVSDFILAIAGPIPFTIRCTHQFWVLGKLWCHLDGFIQVTVMQVSVTSLSIISIDRLLGILTPSYSHLKKWQAFLYIAGIWVFSCVLGVPFYIYRNFGVHEWADVTEVYCEEYLTKTKYYWLIIIVALNWIPLMIMTTCYLHLFLFFKKNSLKRIENGTAVSIKNKKRLLKMLFVMILAFVFCWIPLQAFIIYREKILFRDDGQVSSPKAYNTMLDLTQYIVYLYPVINPFIYSLMHQNFKNGFRVTFPFFFKEEPELVLTRGHGSRAYVWSRTSVRHTIHATSYEANRRTRIKNSPNSGLRRTFSFDAGACDTGQEKRTKKKSVTFSRRLSDISGSIERSRSTSIVSENHENITKEINSLLLLDVANFHCNSISRSSSLVPPPDPPEVKPEDDVLTKEQVFENLRMQGSPEIPKHLQMNQNFPKYPKSPKSPSDILKTKIFTFDFSPKTNEKKKPYFPKFPVDDCSELNHDNLRDFYIVRTTSDNIKMEKQLRTRQKRLELNPNVAKYPKYPKSPTDLLKSKIFTFDFNPALPKNDKSEKIRNIPKFQLEDYDELNPEVSDLHVKTSDNNKSENQLRPHLTLKKSNSSQGLSKIQSSLKQLGTKIGDNLNSFSSQFNDDHDEEDESFV